MSEVPPNSRFPAARLIVLTCALFLGSACSPEPDPERPPNILMILVDDLGYSDIEPLGSEIPTPNIATLAAEGMTFTNFHTAMKCNPTRAMFLTGLDNNLGASGPRTNYQLREDVPTLAEELREAGYHTYIAGKWDVGSDTGERPFDRGFDQSFVMLGGAGLHFRAFDGADVREDGTTSGYSENGKDTVLPEDFYSTAFYTKKIIEFIEGNRNDARPFFAYAAYTAPHYPLQAPAEYIAKFDGWYEDGYQALHEKRIRRMRELGLINTTNTPWPAENVPDWTSLGDEEKAYEAKRMQVYAAMIASLDTSIGELLAYIDESDLSENTIVVFASDNGADGTSRGAGFRDVYDNSTGNLGSASSYVTEGFNWAQISSTPWRLVKSHPTEGGTRTPMIVRWPGKVEAGTRSSAWLRISDLKPAFLELAGGRPDKSTLPALIDGEEIYAATDARIHTYIERRLGGASVLQGQWKLAWWKENGTYIKPMLFEIGNDPMETTDIAAENSDTVAYLAEEWRRYAKIVGEGVSEANPVVE